MFSHNRTSISIIFYISNIWIPKYMRQAKQQGFVLHPICRAEEEQKQQTHRLHLPFAVRH